MSGTARIEDVSCLRQTDKAILVAIDGKELWVPQSVIDDDSEVWKKGDEGALVVHRWFAVRHELEEDE